jgi:uncharacterized protein YdaU (DUF1376 family)
MGDRPWYKRYPSDFIGGIVGLGPELIGAYSVALDLIQDRGGPVPNDPRWIGGIMGCSTRKAKALIQGLADKGKITISEAGLDNPRAKKDREKAAKKHAAKSVSDDFQRTFEPNSTFENLAKPTRNNAENEGESKKINGMAQKSPSCARARVLDTRGYIEKKETPPDAIASIPPLGANDGLPLEGSQPPCAGSKAARSAGSASEKRGRRLPENWSPSDKDRAYAQNLGFAEQEIDDAAREFRNYWLDKSGKDACKITWSRTWQNRCHQLAERRERRAHGQPPRGNGRDLAGVVRAVFELNQGKG